jgi:(p)ppGpp synthase/HD superfamily hydrolase
MRPTLEQAIEFATRAHDGQVRKYTGEPYVTHPIAVSEIVRSVPHTEDMLIAAVLHDTVEDTDVTLADIEFYFGRTVMDLVFWLTDSSRPQDGNRATRKAIDRDHLAAAPAAAQTIKVADLLHNTLSIVSHDPDFAIVYMREKRLLLDVLTQADQGLLARAEQFMSEYFGS